MLYETLLHGQVFCAMLYFGLLTGIIFEIKLLIEKPFKHNVFKILPDIIFGIICGFIFIKSMNMFNYGEFRVYLLIAYIIGIVIEHKTIGFLVEKIISIIYTFCVKLFNKLKKVKLLKRIFK